MFMINSWLTAV